MIAFAEASMLHYFSGGRGGMEAVGQGGYEYFFWYNYQSGVSLLVVHLQNIRPK